MYSVNLAKILSSFLTKFLFFIKFLFISFSSISYENTPLFFIVKSFTWVTMKELIFIVSLKDYSAWTFSKNDCVG